MCVMVVFLGAILDILKFPLFSITPGPRVAQSSRFVDFVAVLKRRRDFSLSDEFQRQLTCLGHDVRLDCKLESMIGSN